SSLKCKHSYLRRDLFLLDKMAKQLICLKDFEVFAKSHLSVAANGYYSSGANYEQTLHENTSAFSQLKICPQFLRKSVAERCMQTTLLGSKVSMPICVSPTAMQRMAHPDGEIATAKACQTTNTIMTLSTIATSSIEEVANAAPSAVKWFQLYIYKDRKVTEHLIRRAESNGFEALVLTIDSPFFGTRYADIRNKFCLPPHLRMANFNKGDQASDAINESKDGSSLTAYVNSLFDASLTWKDVQWLKKFTKLKVIIKGVLTPEDALKAVEVGASAIIVSNHGARQLDSVPATIAVLPEIVSAVGNKCEVYIDGGIRSGTDILKALALGAKAVFIGRPILWGLCYDVCLFFEHHFSLFTRRIFKGEEGVKQVLDILRKELDVAMALSGCATLDDISAHLIRHERSFFSKL
ncbi:hydroxyacid oxidase 1-like protein, partial [Leptotrombidium deliense]